MSSKNKVDITIKGNRNAGVFAGRSIGNSSLEESENEVKTFIEGDDNQAMIAGSDIEKLSQVNDALSELADLLKNALKDKDEKEDVQELIEQIKEQAAKSEPARSKPKIQRVLTSLSSYIGLVGVAVTQAERIKALYEQILVFFK
jgi:hypothetical protein